MNDEMKNLLEFEGFFRNLDKKQYFYKIAYACFASNVSKQWFYQKMALDVEIVFTIV